MRPLEVGARIALHLSHRMLYRSDPTLCCVHSQGVALQLPRWGESVSKVTRKGPAVCKGETELMYTSHCRIHAVQPYLEPQGREAHEKKSYAA